jgi:hypothetical protein
MLLKDSISFLGYEVYHFKNDKDYGFFEKCGKFYL